MKKTAAMLCVFILSACTTGYKTQIDKKSAEKVDDIITTRVLPNRHAERSFLITEISASFLNTPYQANTLIGSSSEPEVLTINFNGVDCFTLLDYVQALSHATDRRAFLKNLKNTRYKDGKVSYLQRRHFFTDWAASSPQNAQDITRKLSTDYQLVTKQLNLKGDGGEYITGAGVTEREIAYIPADKVNEKTLAAMQDGDFIGIYSTLQGLDVSHVGFLIKKEGEFYFRNASSLSANMKVIDVPLMEYIKTRPGIVVLRSI